MDLVRLENELKQRTNFPYNWGRKQSDDWDFKTNFIYNTYSFRTLQKRIELFEIPVKNYAMNRWYNFWSAMAVENIFAEHPNVIANKNSYDKLVDFKINTIDFDHKTSIFPKGFNKSLEFAKENQKELILWLYKNQSQQGRKHLKNRLFVVLFNKNGQHWKMKSEINELKKIIDRYMANYDESKIEKLDFGNGVVYSDIIWFEN